MTLIRVPQVKSKHAELVVFGDLHYGCKEQDRKLIKRMVEYVIQTNADSIALYNEPTCYAVTVGDTLDNAIKGKFGTIGADKSVETAFEEFKQDFKPLLDKKYFIGACPGNHDSRITKALGSSFDPVRQHLAEYGIEYGDPNLILNWTVGESNFTGLISHGFGGGATAGTVANSMMKQVNELSDFDYSVQGHFHRFMYTSNLRPYLKKMPLSICYQIQHYFTVGSCLKKSYYAREARLTESPTTGLIIQFKDRLHSKDKKSIIFKIIEGE